MRILFTHPYFWPHVRRGAEREIHDLGTRLVADGHRVRLVTSQPHGLTSRATYDGLAVRYLRTPLPAPLGARGWSREAVFGAVAAAAAGTARADLVHAWLYADGFGAHLGRLLRPRRRRPALVLKLTGTVRAERIADRRVERALFLRALEAADEVWCNSAWAKAEMAEFGVPMQVIPAGLDTGLFRPGPRAAQPVVFAASASDDPRKRVVDLVAAWPTVLDAVPTATLRIAGHASAQTRARLLSLLPERLHRTVGFLGPLQGATLAREYAAAWVYAAPAVYEALGLTTLEAQACGTPVAGARSGATSDLVAEGRTGALFEPTTPADCAAAVIRLLQEPPGEPMVRACRQAAEAYAWQRIVPLVEQRYLALRPS